MHRTLDTGCCIYATEEHEHRHPACKTTRSGQNHPMRNPDPWSPMEPEEPEVPEPLGRSGDGRRDGDGDGPEEVSNRRGALVGLMVVLLLVAGGLLLTHVLRSMAQVQDCALSGRSNCT
jgi:hypothetical protein